MKDTRLTDVILGREDNYLLPFYWQHGTHRDRIPAQVQRIYDSGCRALCVESRPHPDFCGPDWWADMDIILAECEKRDMKVWILDDKRFPTGYANGMIEKKGQKIRLMKSGYLYGPFAAHDRYICERGSVCRHFGQLDLHP